MVGTRHILKSKLMREKSVIKGHIPVQKGRAYYFSTPSRKNPEIVALCNISASILSVLTPNHHSCESLNYLLCIIVY